MDNFEKNYERTVDRAVGAVEKTAGCAGRVWNGCIIVFANLFFAGFLLWGVYAGYISWKLEKEGVIGHLCSEFISTSGLANPLSNTRRMGKEMAGKAKSLGVDAIILTST